MADVLAQVKTMVEADWNASNTNSRTPTVSNIADLKRISLKTGDYILTHELLRLPEDNASGASSKRAVTTVVLSIRTELNRAHAVLMREELRRVLNNQQTDPFGDSVYDITDVTEERDMSDSMVHLWRIDVTWRLEQFNIAV